MRGAGGPGDAGNRSRCASGLLLLGLPVVAAPTPFQTQMSRFHSCTSIAVAASLSLLPPAMAQQPLPAGLVLPADAFRSAIHDEPGPGGARTVAAGDDYSVEFGDRIVVRPHDFAANWSWQTRASAVRSVETSAWRYLARRDECTEVWDVRGEGLEQSFVIDAAPAGDVVVRGKIVGAVR